MGASEVHLECRGIGKRFGGVRALSDVSVRLRRGSIHGLVGENGAGKSTLGRIMAGALLPDEGELLVDGESVSLRNPRAALRRGIALIAQEIALAPALTVLENVFLGVEPVTAGFLRGERPREVFARLNEQTGFGLNPDARVNRLRIADQQKVEILRALAREARLIVMDEPTAALGADDTVRLLEVIRALRAGGATIVYVSHFLSDVLNLVDEVTVLKDGVVVLEGAPAANQTAETLVSAMIGRQLDTAYRNKQLPAESGAPVLSVRGLSRGKAFADISFDVSAGEALGLAGLVGSGRSEVVRAIFGAERPEAGSILLHGRPLHIRTPRDAVRAGIAMIPESRKDQGLLMGRPVLENISLPHLDSFSWGPFLQGQREQRSVESASRQVDVRAESLAAPIYRLSGGNQQKALFARWLLQRPAVLIADEPTRGVDIGAKIAIHELIAALAAGGTAVIVISSDFDEVARLAHRALVMRSGRIVAEYRGGEVTEPNLVHAAFGTTADAAAGGERGTPT